MTDLIEKARLGRTNALTHISSANHNIFQSSRSAPTRRALPCAFVSSRARLGANATLV